MSWWKYDELVEIIWINEDIIQSLCIIYNWKSVPNHTLNGEVLMPKSELIPNLNISIFWSTLLKKCDALLDTQNNSENSFRVHRLLITREGRVPLYVSSQELCAGRPLEMTSKRLITWHRSHVEQNQDLQVWINFSMISYFECYPFQWLIAYLSSQYPATIMFSQRSWNRKCIRYLPHSGVREK